MDNTQTIYIYNGVDDVPNDVTHVRVDPSVTVIPDNAFKRRESLVDIDLPEGLIRIGEYAFQTCKSLKRINTPSTVKEIGDRAFESCTKLDKIVLPNCLRSLGRWAFSHCESLKSINIPPNIETIGRAAFLSCYNLEEVTCSEGLREIGKDAFSYCRSLVSINLPSTLEVIGVEAFDGCDLLNEVHMPDTLESIGRRAFNNCNITSFRLIPSVDTVDISIVGRNSCLVSLELPETIEELDDYYDDTEDEEQYVYTDLSVRNIALPSDCEMNTTALYHCTDLKLVLLDDDDDYNDNDTAISEALRHRFDVLPIHKICYYQSYHDTETTMQSLKREINPWTSKPPGQLNKSGKEQDCLGMTPLHILACSTKPTNEMFQLLIDKYPETLIMKDKWGDIPVLYAIWCNAPTEVLDLLVESYKSFHPEYEFGWSGMIQTMAKQRVPLPNIQKLVSTQRRSFPDQEYDMKSVVIELTTSRQFVPTETLEYLFLASIAKRLELLGITKWRVDMENRGGNFKALYQRLNMYELAKEATSVLELVLWKHKMDKSAPSNNVKSVGQSNKRARVDTDISRRQQCRINCGADIIIRNVLPYLLPK